VADWLPGFDVQDPEQGTVDEHLMLIGRFVNEALAVEGCFDE
jgi:hypothetical protein